MKRAIIVFVCIFSVLTTCFAADSSWSFLKGVKAIELEVDYHQAIINNMDEQEFIQYYSQYISQENWYAASQKYWEGSFLNECSDQIHKKACRIGKVQDAKIKLLITLLSATDNGDLQVKITFINKENGSTLNTIEMNSKGGHFGGIISLISDGFEHLGEKVGKLLLRQL